MADNKEVENSALARVKDYKQIFSSQAGERVLRDLIKQHHVLSCTFDPAAPNRHIFWEGERNVVLRILKLINVNPERLRKIVEDSENGE